VEYVLLLHRVEVGVTLRHAQGEFMVSSSNHPPPLYPLPPREGSLSSKVIFYGMFHDGYVTLER